METTRNRAYVGSGTHSPGKCECIWPAISWAMPCIGHTSRQASPPRPRDKGRGEVERGHRCPGILCSCVMLHKAGSSTLAAARQETCPEARYPVMDELFRTRRYQYLRVISTRVVLETEVIRGERKGVLTCCHSSFFVSSSSSSSVRRNVDGYPYHVGRTSRERKSSLMTAQDSGNIHYCLMCMEKENRARRGLSLSKPTCMR